MGRLVVLLGPPGSGKSTVGAELGRRGLRWRDWESELLDRWGSAETFVANKEPALAEFHQRVLALADAEGTPLVFEPTGLSDSRFLDRLQGQRPDTLIVRLDVSEDEAVRRVTARPAGEHLSDEVERNRAVWRAFEQAVRSARRIDLVVDTARVHADGAAGAVLQLLQPRLPSWTADP